MPSLAACHDSNFANLPGYLMCTSHPQLYAPATLNAHNSSCTPHCFVPLLLVALFSLLPRTPHPFSPDLANPSSLKTQLTCHLPEEVFLDRRIRCLSSVFLWYPVHVAITVTLLCFKIACTSSSLFWQKKTWWLNTLVTYFAHKSSIWVGLGENGLSLLHATSARAALPKPEDLLPRWFIHRTDKQVLPASSSPPGSFHRAI